MKRFLAWLLLLAAGPCVRGEFLFAPAQPTDNGFFTPTMSFIDGEYEYSAWDIFYAPYGVGNYPDVFAPAGGVWDEEAQVWRPELRSAAGFPTHPAYNPADAYAFWDTYNATITQTKSNTTFIIGPDVSGNIYTFQDKTAYQLHNDPDFSQLGSVIFQFQTDGTNVDFSKIRLGYRGQDGNIYYLGVDAPETEYLREYATTGSEHWSATAGYRNRVLFQWDLSGVAGTGEFWIEWDSLSSSMSFQKADLVTSSYYEVGMPVSSTWMAENGVWSDASNWVSQSGSVPLENGNLKFKTSMAAMLDVDDADHLVGEIIFENAGDVTIGSSANHKLTSNTGVTTRSTAPDAASKTYTFETDYEFGALNFFEINTGRVVMNGEISGNYGLVKLGAGTLELNGNNTFTGFLAVQAGTVRMSGSNAYAGSTTVVNGRLIAASDDPFGAGTSPIMVGGDAGLYAYTTNSSFWLGELLIEGDHEVSRDIALAAGDLGKRLGAFGTTGGAVFSGDISFSGNPADPDAGAGDSAVGNTRLTAQTATDVVTFRGAMTGGVAAKTVTLDGLGTVVFEGANKTYSASTVVSSGRLLIAEGTALAGGGNVSVASGARLTVQGSLTTTGSLSVAGGTLEVNGTLAGSGALNFTSGALVTGSGEILRNFAITNGTVISPGNSPGSMNTASQTWGGGGIYLWEMASAESGAGTGWDLLGIAGQLQITATSGQPFEIRVVSLDFSNVAHAVADFDELTNYAWVIATTTGGISGFNRSSFFINTAGFENSHTGTFDVAVVGNDLVLKYTAVPEPATWLLLVGATALWVIRSRRRNCLAAQFPAASSQPQGSADRAFGR